MRKETESSLCSFREETFLLIGTKGILQMFGRHDKAKSIVHPYVKIDQPVSEKYLD